MLRGGRYWNFRAALAALAMAWAATIGGCREPARDPRPSILLVVLDTLRADAVSALGELEGTTPHLDALAADGLLYTRAHAPAPWTLPSHASLFTGLLPHEHGVALRGSMVASPDLVTLAERLRDAGYETFGISENPFVSETFGLAQGFEQFHSFDGSVDVDPEDLRARVDGWLSGRDEARPFFVFVNVMDAHEPYRVEAQNPFVQPPVEAERLRSLDQSMSRICQKLPPPDELARLRGLYLGDVADADAKLGAAHDLADAAARDGLITIVTSDHGQHLGEHRLLGHQWSVRTPLLHVPLVVHGLESVPPARLDDPVDLVDVQPSILHWAGEVVPPGLAGRPLPTAPVQPVAERALLSVLTDFPSFDWPESLGPPPIEPLRRRGGCGEADPLRGHMVTLTRFPYRLIWFERYPNELYDLRWDAAERSDLVRVHPEVASRMAAEVEAFVASAGFPDERDVDPQRLQPMVLEALRALGYLE